MTINDLTFYPKSKERFLQYLKKILLNFEKEISEEETVISDEMVQIASEAVLTGNPRLLFDFFDENKVFLSINAQESDFNYDVGEGWSIGFSDRKSAETEGLKRCFEILEQKL